MMIFFPSTAVVAHSFGFLFSSLSPHSVAGHVTVIKQLVGVFKKTQSSYEQGGGGYTMPVSVPVNSGHYGDGTVNLGGLHAHASPGHPSVMGAPGHPGASPRPSSSSGMLDVGGNNGYPPNPSPVPDSPPPASSSQQPGVLKSNAMVRPLSPQQPQQSTHSLVGSHIQRPSLRVVIPGPQSGLAISSHDRGNLN